MMETKKSPPKAFIPGGDGRMVHTAKVLATAGCTVILYGQDGNPPSPDPPEELTASADLIVLPVPVSRDGITLNAPMAKQPIPLDRIISSLRAGQLVAGGNLPARLVDSICQRNCAFYDCLADESFALPNALATAEGAIAIAIAEIPDLLTESDCAILGYGRIGKHLARLLTAMGAKVTVFARKERARVEATAAGCTARPLNDFTAVSAPSLIFNTIPTRLFDFSTLPTDSTVIDLAPVYAASNAPRVIRAAALPAKYAPRFAGRLLGECILAALHEAPAFTDRKEEAL